MTQKKTRVNSECPLCETTLHLHIYHEQRELASLEEVESLLGIVLEEHMKLHHAAAYFNAINSHSD